MSDWRLISCQLACAYSAHVHLVLMLHVFTPGDTRPTQNLVDLAKQGHGTDLLLLQAVGPVLDFDELPYFGRYMLNVRL